MSIAHAQLQINELMQSNIDCIMDDINEFPDSWVELYNNSTTTVDLGEYKLGDSDDATAAWQLPSQSVAPYGYVVVYCDKESNGLHTDFRLDSGKGAAAYLFKGDEVADKVSGLKKQPAPNIAWGRLNETSTSWGYQYSPTPGKKNCGTLCTTILGEPIFSEKGRVIIGQQNISLTLTTPEGSPEGTEIRYTINGSEPTRLSYLYQSPISITETQVVRAKLFCRGYLSPRSTTQSFIFHPRTQTLPIISIVTDDKYLNDDKIGIYVDGTYNTSQQNYKYDWRRPINIEYFEQSGEESRLNQLCETRIQGGATRENPRKSLAIYANKRFGAKRFEYEFFPDQRPGVTDFKSLVLRNAGNDFWGLYLRDAIIQRTMASHTDLDWQAWAPSIVYINGTYMGLLNIRERSNEDNIYTHYDGLEDIDMFENWWELKEGDWQNYNAFRDFYNEHGHTLAEYEQWIDWKEFINLMLMNLYYNNQDFPGNNIVMWRPRTADGVWRFIAKDTDFGLGLYDSSPAYNTIEWIYNPDYDADHAWANKYEHTRLFRRMMEDADFKREFIDRAAVYMGDFMNERGTRAVWDPMYERIKTEYQYHHDLLNKWWPDYAGEMTKAQSWLAQRTDEFYKQIANYYSLGTPTPLTVNKELSDEDRANVDITFNDIPVTTGIFDGKFFRGRAMSLKAKAHEGKVVKGWNITVVPTATNTPISFQTTGDTYNASMSNVNTMTINVILEDDLSGIDNIEQNQQEWTWSKNNNMIHLRGLADNTRVRLYDCRGILVFDQKTKGGETSVNIQPHNIYILKVGDKTIKIND